MARKKSSKNIDQRDENEEQQLKHRQPCYCEASEHDLVNNCLVCGRIVCLQEGPGPCFTCGTYVFNQSDRELLQSGSNQAQKMIEELLDNNFKLDFNGLGISERQVESLSEIAASISSDPNLQKAIEQKNKLLEFDRKSVARTKVFDDQVDYFTLQRQNFVSEETRQAINEKIDYLRENKFKITDKLTIDLENLTVKDYAEPVIKNIDEEHEILEEMSAIKTDYEIKSSNRILKEELQKNLPEPIYIPPINPKVDSNQQTPRNLAEKYLMRDNSRIQDGEMNKIDDKGMCLAVQQPYASLIVHGIKRFEARNWFSSFKGRLWIYAAQKKPSDKEVMEIVNFYSMLNGQEKFPRHYPCGTIVGCVIVDECLANEIYRDKYPECELDSPYVFVLDNPIPFSRPLPISKGGGEKIYKLDANVHKACKRLLGF
ncbi:prenylated rab acceptor 1 [Sarcoptes scabiei]|nr:prenylated rab acceptor 1 [Sarcoptes scabiei]